MRQRLIRQRTGRAVKSFTEAAGITLTLMLVACAAPEPMAVQAVQTTVDYSAIQVIDTVPGPFVNRIYVSADKERQDASLGGGVVTTIIRRDKGVAWLLIPAKQQYEEIALADAAGLASVQTRFAGLLSKEIARERLDGWLVKKMAYYEESGRHVADVWLTDEGIVFKTEFFADPQSGQPQAVISLQQVKIGTQDAQLFELPADYRKQKE